MLVNLSEVLKKAQNENYAVGLFNTVNLEMAVGVLAAAEELRSPVIIGSAECLLCYSGLDDLANMLLPMAKRASVPVVLHFDHGLTEENVKKAIALGFSSVMYDCSTLGFEENLSAVKAICDYSHSKGITVEAEIGHVGTDEICAPADAYTDPDEAKRFAEFTGCDALESFTVPKGMTEIPKSTFENCKNLKRIKLNGLRNIGEYVFYGCK